MQIMSAKPESKETFHAPGRLVVAGSGRRSYDDLSGNTVAGSVVKRERLRPHHIFCEEKAFEMDASIDQDS